MAAIPSERAMRGELWGIARPRRRSSPASGCTAPVTTLTSVDLPAPFSPTSAWISPLLSSKEAERSAWTPAYALATPRAASRTSAMRDRVSAIPMGKRIVFTGGSGKAGKHVVPHLLSHGYEVLNLDLRPLDHPGVHTLMTDVADG